MATLVLGLVGQGVGNALLPAGFTLFGQAISGATIGGALGAFAGAQIDAMLSGSARVQGPRLKELQVQASTPGAAVARCWGSMRLAGQVIWAARFSETEEQRGGGKSGPRASEFHYAASFAVGLCEGAIGGIGRVWADGKPMALDGVTMRIHQGTEDQDADPLIETVEGTAPAYRGLAYVVFEDLPLEAFGNRVPQLSFEVMKPLRGDGDALEQAVEAVCLIPGSGEFALGTTRVLRDLGRGAWQAENANNRAGRSDLDASLDQLQAMLPNVRRVALVVTWFGDDLRAGTCRIRPGVESALKRTHPEAWRVAGIEREDAYVVSDTDGRPNFGGTPSDASVLEAIASLKARGMEVTLYPFVMMDVPAGNGLPDPHGGAEQAAFPWRGRITCHPAPGEAGSPDKTASAATQIGAFFTGEWGLRRMILHYAALAAEAGGVETFLLGSELGGVTRVRSGASAYPAVTALKTLAGDVRAVAGGGTKISYAADWTEWAGHDPADGSGDYFFHLDPLWSDANIDFIGIDNYAPLADWRDGATHLDYAASATRSILDRAYLQANIEGGEKYDWHYASDADGAAQIRSPIGDGAYGKPWVFRIKDVRNWWLNPHHDRPGGVEAALPTGWVPQSKPVRFTEIGCPAVEKGANQPNVFFDPRSSESALPHYSSGARDDAMQRAMLEAALGYWRDGTRNPTSSVYGASMVEAGHAHVWAWDSRPFPDFPLRGEVWADGALWRTGHWLNGRAGASPLGALVREICATAGVASVDVAGLRGACAGYALDRIMSAREALAPPMSAYAIEAAESGGTIRFFHRGDGEAIAMTPADLAERAEGESAEARLVRSETAALPAAAKAVYLDPLADYQSAAAEARLNAAPSSSVIQIELPLALTRSEADGAAARALHEAWAAREGASFALPPSRVAAEPGDAVALEVDGSARPFRLTRVSEQGRRVAEAGRLVRHLYAPAGAELDGVLPAPPPAFGPPLIALMDLAPIALRREEAGPFAAAYGEPWPGAVTVRRAGEIAEIARLTRRAAMGETGSVLHAGPVNVWDRASRVDVLIYGGVLSAASEIDVLNGANRAAIETAPGLWEVIQFADAELVAPGTWRLSMLLRGQAGTEFAMAPTLAAGARFVLLNEAAQRLAVGESEAGTAIDLIAGPVGAPADDPGIESVSFAFEGRGRKPWSPCRARAVRAGSDIEIGWTRRARDDPGFWSEYEVALGEERELYRLDIMDGGDIVRSIACEAPSALYSAAMQASDWGGAASPPLAVRIAQISPRVGAGAALEASLSF